MYRHMIKYTESIPGYTNNIQVQQSSCEFALAVWECYFELARNIENTCTPTQLAPKKLLHMMTFARKSTFKYNLHVKNTCTSKQQNVHVNEIYT